MGKPLRANMDELSTGGFENDMVDILGFEHAGSDRAADDALGVFSGDRMMVKRVLVTCNTIPGTVLMEKGINALVPLEKYDAVLTGEHRVSPESDIMVEITYELSPLGSSVFTHEGLFRLLDAVMTILEDYSPRVEL